MSTKIKHKYKNWLSMFTQLYMEVNINEFIHIAIEYPIYFLLKIFWASS